MVTARHSYALPSFQPAAVTSQPLTPAVPGVTIRQPGSSHQHSSQANIEANTDTKISVPPVNQVSNKQVDLNLPSQLRTRPNLWAQSALQKPTMPSLVTNNVQHVAMDNNNKRSSSDSNTRTINSHFDKLPNHVLLASAVKKSPPVNNASTIKVGKPKRVMPALVPGPVKVPRLLSVPPSLKNSLHPTFTADTSQKKEQRPAPDKNQPSKTKTDEGKTGNSNPPKGCWGRWTPEEHQLFLEALSLYGKQWTKIAAKVKTRTVLQTRTHAQKYFIKLQKGLDNLAEKGLVDKSNISSLSQKKKPKGKKLPSAESAKHKSLIPPSAGSSSTKETPPTTFIAAKAPPMRTHLQIPQIREQGQDRPNVSFHNNVLPVNDSGHERIEQGNNSQNGTEGSGDTGSDQRNKALAMTLQRELRKREIARLQVNEIKREIEKARIRAEEESVNNIARTNLEQNQMGHQTMITGTANSNMQVQSQADATPQNMNMQIQIQADATPQITNMQVQSQADATPQITNVQVQSQADAAPQNTNIQVQSQADATPQITNNTVIPTASGEMPSDNNTMTPRTSLVVQYPAAAPATTTSMMAPQIQITLPKNDAPSGPIPTPGTVAAPNAPLIGYVVLPPQPQYVIVNQNGQLQQVQVLQTQPQIYANAIAASPGTVGQYGQTLQGNQPYQIGQVNTTNLIGGRQLPVVTTVSANPISVGISAGQIPVGVTNSYVPGAVNSPYSLGITTSQVPGIVTNQLQQQVSVQPSEAGTYQPQYAAVVTQEEPRPPWQTMSSNIYGDSEQGNM